MENPPKLSSQPNFPQLEEDVLARWKEQKIFEKTLEATKNGKHFVFFEGPPTANGKPGIHHVLARAFKDVIPRFKTMQGFFVERKAGWDTHGLPVELSVEKKLGLKSKKEIEEYGIAKFNEECRASVWQYKEEWEKLTKRIGFWLDLEHPYITYDKNYIESVWWILKQIWDKDLLYQGHKVVPHCPRCGTALSSHEVAQGYETVKDTSVYVKFKLEPNKQIGNWTTTDNTYILAWTTTPWTLPGNVALAVGSNIEYKILQLGKEFLILAKEAYERLYEEHPTWFQPFPAGILTQDSTSLTSEYVPGEKLIGLRFKPLFDFLDLGKITGKKAYYITDADFVTTQDGTGVVHTAVMYGEDDYALGEKIGLPKHHTVGEDGTFTSEVGPFAGMFVKDNNTEKAINDYLQEHGELFKEEQYEHEYPFCWRCHSPLLYYAKNSWFIKMSSLRQQLNDNNQQINWVPDNIKEGRFGEWLKDVKDWAISRERYWGTPLPIWQCTACKHQECIGSFGELAKRAPSKNRYLFTRHGHSTKNIDGTINIEPANSRQYPLTKKGEQQIKTLAQSLAGTKVDAIYTSSFYRAKQSAEILAKSTGSVVKEDSRLNEYQLGKQFEGMNSSAVMDKHFPRHSDQFRNKYPESETLYDLWIRVRSLLVELENTYEGKTFVLVTHGDPLMIAQWACAFQPESLLPEIEQTGYPQVGKVIDVHFPAAMFQPDGTFDPHRPFVDDIVLQCESCGSNMHRIKELCDVWFDSGSMPFSQWHYPIENAQRIDSGSSYPADYISEAIDQTRGWFYTLLAVSTLLDKGTPFKNVICLGHILDAQGKKMSKHLGNVVDPWSVIDQHGADALRFHFFTMSQPGEPKLFDVKGVADVVRKNFLILWNVVSFWELVSETKERSQGEFTIAENAHVLDQWIWERLNVLISDVTQHLDTYHITEAGRELASFIDELSTWYVRRSRERLKSENGEAARGLLQYVLLTVSKLLAPLTPFFAESVYNRVGGSLESVHLESWPTVHQLAGNLVEAMRKVRSLVEAGHALREQAKIRVRQPLGQFVMTGTTLEPGLAKILQEELNVKEVIAAKILPTGRDWIRQELSPESGVALDTTITDELRYEGWVRELIRAVNDVRKQAKLTPQDRVPIFVFAESETVKGVFQHNAEAITKEVRASKLSFELPEHRTAEKTFLLDGGSVTVAIIKSKDKS